MTKLTVPQIGDIVQGQRVTEAGHKLLVDLADKVDALESVASEDFAEEFAEINNSISTIQDEISVRPKIEVYNASESISPIESDFDLYDITFEFEITLVSGGATVVNLLPDVGVTSTGAYVVKSYNAIDETIQASLSFTATKAHLESGGNNTVQSDNASGRVFTPIRWIVRKYKLEN